MSERRFRLSLRHFGRTAFLVTAAAVVAMFLWVSDGLVRDLSRQERERMQDEIERRKKEKNKPRRIAGFIMTIAGFALFMSPFFAGSRASDFFGLAPVGMALIVVGSVLCKQ